MATYILIEAESDVYSVKEVVLESKAVKKLEQIRDNFMYLNNRHGNNAVLKVKTGIHNPKLFS